MRGFLFRPLLSAKLLSCLIWLLGGISAAEATPYYSIGSGSTCNTCHIEPLNWKNPAIKDRRCTLDCKGCHISPTGGGLRTPFGRFYGEETLPIWGGRPSDGVDVDRYRPKGFPNKGQYSLFKGFSGWWPGKIPHREIPDRLGKINPTPKAQFGADFRMMNLLAGDFGFQVFPMEAQAYLAYNPSQKLTFYADVGLQGAVGELSPEILWVRETFAMVHDLPYNSYIRAGRFTLPYGWRLPDHTALTRAGLFDQFRQAYGVEMGVIPNEGWLNLALWKQGLVGWPGDFQQPGIGVTAQGGVRKLGFQLGASVHAMKADPGGEDELMAGPLFALNLNPFIYLGEFDVRRTIANGVATDSLITLHEVRWQVARGVAPKLRYEWLDPVLNEVGDNIHRVQAALELNPTRYFQLEFNARETLEAGFLRTDVFVQLHGWFR